MDPQAFYGKRSLEFAKKQSNNPTSEFLLHETGEINNGPKHTNFADLDKRNYVAQFPSLPSQSSSPTSITGTRRQSANSGKRDYVSPQFPPINNAQSPQTTTATTIRPLHNSGIRDSVNPKLQSNYNNEQSAATRPTQNSEKRDYVNPQFPPLKSDKSQPSSGAVKDLINFYDNKNAGQSKPQAIFSYSSILKGGDNKPSLIQPHTVTQKPNPQQTKATTISFTASGTPKPNRSGTTSLPKENQYPKPGGLVLPGTLVNNNKNTNNLGSSNANVISDSELQNLSEELLRKDSNNAAKLITINYQEKTTSQSKADKAPLPLLTVPTEVWNIPTIEKFVLLLDNYERDTLVNEHVTPQERNEENAFMDAIMSTTVIRHLMKFLKDKGYVTADTRQQRDYLKQLWFTLYSRGKGKISSSGFEHVFVSELKNGEVSGLHNWIYFSKEESAGRLNYLGYLKYLQLNDKGAVMKLHFNQQGTDKPVDSLFIGTSPELEMSLYTLCFVVRADNDCKLKLGGKDVSIISHTFRYRSKNYIGSAYAQI